MIKLRFSYVTSHTSKLHESVSWCKKYQLLFPDLLHCTNEPNVSIPTLANLLIERTQNPSWVVVYKALITTHHLMCYGNEVSINQWVTLERKFSSILRFRGSRNISPQATATSSWMAFWTRQESKVCWWRWNLKRLDFDKKIVIEKTCTINMNHLDYIARFNAKITSFCIIS